VVSALAGTDELRVWVDQDLAYVKDAGGELLQSPGVRTDVPAHLRLEVIDAAKECPGDCIHVVRAADEVEVAGPDAD
jgi:ferredoxin